MCALEFSIVRLTAKGRPARPANGDKRPGSVGPEKFFNASSAKSAEAAKAAIRSARARRSPVRARDFSPIFQVPGDIFPPLNPLIRVPLGRVELEGFPGLFRSRKWFPELSAFPSADRPVDPVFCEPPDRPRYCRTDGAAVPQKDPRGGWNGSPARMKTSAALSLKSGCGLASFFVTLTEFHEARHANLQAGDGVQQGSGTGGCQIKGQPLALAPFFPAIRRGFSFLGRLLEAGTGLVSGSDGPCEIRLYVFNSLHQTIPCAAPVFFAFDPGFDLRQRFRGRGSSSSNREAPECSASTEDLRF